jgi:hypothetical protein
MGKKFKKLILTTSNEVSLCSKYNSGANKQTEFEIIKNKDSETMKDIKPTLQEIIKFIDLTPINEQSEEVKNFKDFLNYWLEEDVNNCLYNLLSDALQGAMCGIKCNDELTKEEKADKYAELFNAFIQEYKNMPITKTKEGKYEVSLVSESHIQENDTNPQNETEVITKEKTSKMEKEEQKSVIQKAIELLTSAFSLEKTETPAETAPEVKEEDKTPVEKTEVEPEAEKPEAEPVEVAKEEVKEEVVTETVEPAEKPAEVEAPIVEQAEVEEEAKPETVEETVEPVEKTVSEPTELETILKQKLDLEKELEEIKKAQQAKEEEITKMSFVQKAKDEYSMLVGTPEEIGEKLYTISKSNLDDASKSFIMEQLKKVSKVNEELTVEMGSMTKSADDMSEEDVLYAKAEEIAKAKNISINKALREIK